MSARPRISPLSGRESYDQTNVQFGGTLGGVLAKSAVVEATQSDTLYQLIFSRQYSRRAAIVPRVGTPTASPGGNLWQNNVNNNPPTATTATTNYTLAVPAGTDQIKYIRLNWQDTARERAAVIGRSTAPASRPKSPLRSPPWLTFPLTTIMDTPAARMAARPTSEVLGSNWTRCISMHKGCKSPLPTTSRWGWRGKSIPPRSRPETPVLDGRGELSRDGRSWELFTASSTLTAPVLPPSSSTCW